METDRMVEMENNTKHLVVVVVNFLLVGNESLVLLQKVLIV